MSAGLSTSRLVVAIDFVQPQSYLAKAATYELERDLGIDVDWLPTSVPPFPAPAAPGEGDDRGTRHLRFRAQYLEQDLQRYAAAQGLVMRGLHRSCDSSLAGRGLLAVKSSAPASVGDYLDRVFDGYWSETLDIEDAEAIGRVLESVGVSGPDLDLERRRDDYDDLRARLSEAGVIGAPTYLLFGEPFLGRAHLPMIRWLLQDRQGPQPI